MSYKTYVSNFIHFQNEMLVYIFLQKEALRSKRINKPKANNFINNFFVVLKNSNAIFSNIFLSYTKLRYKI